MGRLLWESPVGMLLLQSRGGLLTGLDFYSGEEVDVQPDFILEDTLAQLREYFEGRRRVFNLPLHFEGTSFQKKVWEALLEVPYGERCSYKDIAHSIGQPKACRAVGGANNKNPISIIAPCHRVVGADGTLTGYGGGLDKKNFLLDMERKYKERALFSTGGF